MTARAGVTVGGDVSVSPQVTCMNLSGSSSAPVARLTLTTEFALGAKRVHGRNANAPHENFLTDARWSPDGVCLLTAGAEDGTFRVYDVPGELPALRGGVGDPGGEKFDDEMNDANETFDDENNGDTNDRLPPDSLWPALRIKAGEAVRDYDWWPKMDAHADTATCLFASACKAQPVHVWDAISGKIKASYCGRNALDEPVDFNVVCFASGAEKIFAGRNNEIRTWDVTRPGYSGDLLWRGGKGGVSFGGSFGGSFGNKNGSSFGNKNAYSSVASTENTFFKGLVTALQSAPLTSTAASSSQVLAAGCAGGIINLFHAQTGEQTVSFTGHADAITRLKWSPCGTFLYSAARRDDRILCWDTRSLGGGAVFTMKRNSSATNQKIGFDVEPSGRHLVSGGTDGVLRAFDLRNGCEAAAWFGAKDAVSDWAFHPHASWGDGSECHNGGNPNAGRAVSVSGARRFRSGADDVARDDEFLHLPNRDDKKMTRGGSVGASFASPDAKTRSAGRRAEQPTCALRVWEYDAVVMEVDAE